MIRKEMESKERKRETEEESMNRKKMESKERKRATEEERRIRKEMESKEKRRREWRKRLLRRGEDQQYPFSKRAVFIGKIKRGAFIPLHSHTKHTCMLLVP